MHFLQVGDEPDSTFEFPEYEDLSVEEDDFFHILSPVPRWLKTAYLVEVFCSLTSLVMILNSEILILRQ